MAAVATPALLVFFLCLGSALSAQADNHGFTHRVNGALTKRGTSPREVAGLAGVQDGVMWAADGFARRSLLTTNGTDYQQNAIDAANARAAAAMAITPRIDPTDGFKKYEGGYDVSNMHYWAVSGGQNIMLDILFGETCEGR